MDLNRKLTAAATAVLTAALLLAAPAAADAATTRHHETAHTLGSMVRVPDHIHVRVNGQLYTSLNDLRKVKGHVRYEAFEPGIPMSLYTSLAQVPRGVEDQYLGHWNLPLTPYQFELMTGEWRNGWDFSVGYQDFQAGAYLAASQAHDGTLGNPRADGSDLTDHEWNLAYTSRYLDGYYAMMKALAQHGVYAK